MPRCQCPIHIRNPSYTPDRPFIDVPCGKCIDCLQNKRTQWSWRLNQEWRSSTTSYFITLTYDDEHLPTDRDGLHPLVKSDLQKWLKRVRKYYEKDKEVHIRYFACGEYGGDFGRPHFHVILFNLPIPDRYYAQRFIEGTWQNGFVQLDYLTGGRIHYTTKYMLKDIAQDDDPAYAKYPPFMVCSKRPILGYRYIEKFKDWHNDDLSRTAAHTVYGTYVRIPDSFISKIFDDATREGNYRSIRKARGESSDRLQSVSENYWFDQYKQGAICLDDLRQYVPDPTIESGLRRDQAIKSVGFNKMVRKTTKRH